MMAQTKRQGNLPNLDGSWTEGEWFGAGDDKTAGDVLRRIRREARDESEKGEWFEELFMRIARTAPELAVAKIHRWRTWPDRLRLTGLDGRDIGVDLVAELTDGTLAAVQCKCYAETHTVGKKEIDSFLSASEAECFGHRWIVSTAKPGANAATAVEAARPNVSWIDFRLYLDRPVDRAAEVRPVRELLPLQQEAVDVTADGLANHDRGTLVMACGTGKTFTALRISERIVPDGGTILFTAPSIALVSQARREWLRHCVKPLLSLVVCSDRSAGGRGTSREDIRRSELEWPGDDRPRTHRRIRDRRPARNQGHLLDLPVASPSECGANSGMPRSSSTSRWRTRPTGRREPRRRSRLPTRARSTSRPSTTPTGSTLGSGST